MIGPDGSQLGIRSLNDALILAREADLDLVEVAPLATPPVCRIMDYGKFRYEESQKAKESRKKTTQIVIKEVKFRPKIGKGDFDTKVRHMAEFLDDGHKVKWLTQSLDPRSWMQFWNSLDQPPRWRPRLDSKDAT